MAAGGRDRRCGTCGGGAGGRPVRHRGGALAREVLTIRALATAQRDDLRELGLERLLYEVELPLVRVLRDMEKAGLALDTKRLAAIARKVGDDVRELEKEIFELAGTEFTI